MDLELRHKLALRALQLYGSTLLPKLSSVTMPRVVMGREFRNPLLVAAGFDKNGIGWRGLLKLGFAGVEIGSATYEPQFGNLGKRLFSDKKNIWNRMGLPNDGLLKIVQRMMPRKISQPVGLSISPQRHHLDSLSVSGHVISMMRAHAGLIPDWYTVNISSPNLGRQFDLDEYEEILKPIAYFHTHIANQEYMMRPPILVKLPHNHSGEFEQSVELAELVQGLGLDGVVVSNASIAFHNGQTMAHSGKHLLISNALACSLIRQKLGPDFTIIGSGGVRDHTDVKLYLNCGADLVQVYSALALEGPFWAQRTMKLLSESYEK